MSDSTIHQDVHYDDDTAQNAFLSSFNDDAQKRPSESDEGAPETQDETPAVTENTEGEPEAEAEGEEQTLDYDLDGAKVKIKVGDDEKLVTIKDLKRLYGQEAALTQKSQKASAQLQAAEADIARTSALSKAMIERAQARFAPYEKIGPAEWAQFAAQLPVDQYNALREEVAAAKQDVDFLTQEADAFMREQQTKAQQAYQTAAQECIKVLSDPEKGIEGFGKPLYDEMMAFTTEMGLPNAGQTTNPVHYKILHMAMLYAKGQKAAKAAEAKAKKAVQNPTRVLKPGNTGKSDGKQAIMNQLRRSGNDDDAEAAFLASFR